MSTKFIFYFFVSRCFTLPFFFQFLYNTLLRNVFTHVENSVEIV